MARRLAGKSAVLIFLLSLSCVIGPQEKPLNPKLLFSVGSSFLDSASSLALKGHIEFSDGRTTQSGGFQMFMAGRDSLSFVIEGPLGADVFRMIVLDTTAYLLSNDDEGWVTLGRLERATVAEYGIDNISPFHTGLFALPQFYIHAIADEDHSRFSFDYNSEKYECSYSGDQKRFSIVEPQGQVIAEYSRRKDIDIGYYPSQIKIYSPGETWQIILRIDKIRLNPQISPRAWRRE